MVIFGLVLLIVGVLGIAAGIFGSEAESTSSKGQTDVHTTFIGIEMSANTLFILGIVALSVMPIVVEVVRAAREHRAGPPADGTRELPSDIATD